MAEAEDLITDAARHTTDFVHGLWRRHRARAPAQPTLQLTDVAQRLDLLIVAVFGTSYPLRTAQPPARTTWLAKTFQPHDRPRASAALPATDGTSLWLPGETGLADAGLALERFRTVALQQAMRACRGSAAGAGSDATPLIRDLYLVIEAHAADINLARLLPGTLGPPALAARPSMTSFPAARRPLEAWLRTLLASPCTLHGAGTDGGAGGGAGADADARFSASPQNSCRIARQLAAQLLCDATQAARLGAQPLFKDWWTGDLQTPTKALDPGVEGGGESGPDSPGSTRSARLERRPAVRETTDDEDDDRQGAWMIQASAPHEVAEDPFGLQRPSDRDDKTAADEFAESLAELAQARLVSTPGRPKEVLISDDPPSTRAPRSGRVSNAAPEAINYPEWDWRSQTYRDPGACVRVRSAPVGPQHWVDATLAQHRSMLDIIRRRFEMLRAQRTPLRRQLDGDELDLEACIDGQADFRAGLPMSQALYRSQRRSRRDMAILLLIDTSGSTDGWVSSNRRVIDVEREALLLVCIALGALGAPFAAQAFSGHGPQSVTVRTLKRFDEPYGNTVATRIAALEPEHYTRAGAAIRHASATLMREPAAHRLLLLLSDGKPNDVDVYEGRYGVEDTRRAVIEARLQGIAPFCLTVDRHAAGYLPAVFGAHQYALLTRPAMLPIVLLDWMQRLLVA